MRRLCHLILGLAVLAVTLAAPRDCSAAERPQVVPERSSCCGAECCCPANAGVKSCPDDHPPQPAAPDAGSILITHRTSLSISLHVAAIVPCEEGCRDGMAHHIPARTVSKLSVFQPPGRRLDRLGILLI